MAIKKTVLDALNKQITMELHSAYSYLSMAAYFDGESLEGFASWMKKQSQEEVNHAMKLYAYINDRDEKVVLAPLPKPAGNFKSALQVFEVALAQEQAVSKSINKIVDIAKRTNDHATDQMLQWFVEEQVEEEATAQAAVDKLKLAKGDSAALLMLDAEMGKRGSAE